MEWISAKDQLPEERGQVFIYYWDITLGGAKVHRMATAFFNKDFESFQDRETLAHGNVTHWMPLPKPPKPTRESDYATNKRYK